MIVTMKAQSDEHRDLTLGQSYFVIGIEADDFRILNDHGKPYLYPAGLFRIIDDGEPGDWVTEIGDSGERYAYPTALNSTGFFEDFFEGNEQAISTFWHNVNSRLAHVA